MSVQRSPSSSIVSSSSSSSLSPTQTPADYPRRSRYGRRGEHRSQTLQNQLHSGVGSSPSTRRRQQHNIHRRVPAGLNNMASGGGSDEGDVFRPSINTRKNSGFYHHANLSNASMDSSALLDHRDQQSMRPRRASTAAFGSVIYDLSRRRGNGGPNEAAMESSDSGSGEDENFPLIKTDKASERNSVKSAKQRGSRPSTSGSRSSPSHPFSRLLQPPTQPSRPYGSVNFPPSVPTSPRIGPIMLGGTAGFGGFGMGENDTIIDIDTDVIGEGPYTSGSPPSSPRDALRSSANIAEEDVCFPVDDALMDDDDETAALDGGHHLFGRCRARREWPDLSVLDAWSREEKEQRSEGIRAKNLPEPVYVGGRLRPPIRPEWHKDEDDAPYRFTYFKEDLPATIHSHTISELLQPGQTFEPLFRPEPVVLDDSSDDEMTPPLQRTNRTNSHTTNGEEAKGGITPPEVNQPLPRLGPRPTFWLDVLRPTDAEMKVISKAFGIHPLTAEDIMMQEAREKVELFRNYYLVSYRTFEQDCNSEDYMEPVNIYVVVFRDGVISFHFSMTPHPANVRRRIRQLKNFITVSADWISYAVIDDITDAFQPLIQSLETQVDDIDDAILRMHLDSDSLGAKSYLGNNDDDTEKSDGDMLKRVGDSRRNVMGLYRLMGNKADVIKGFAKRCNEQWEVAPRSEIGLYLGDIQDHIITMVSNLNHMEKILSRSHSNYLAQINIKMNERQEQTADVLGRLTVLGTIVLPMNIITGLWGMNVKVPGQDIENLDWFWSITAGLLFFGFFCYFVAKRVYKIM